MQFLVKRSRRSKYIKLYINKNNELTNLKNGIQNEIGLYKFILKLFFSNEINLWKDTEIANKYNFLVKNNFIEVKDI